MSHWKINLIFGFIVLFAAAILVRLFFLQVVHYDFYAALASGQQIDFLNSQGERGSIFMQNHNLPVASEKTSYFIYLSPAEVPSGQKEEAAQSLSELLGMSQDFLLSKLQKENLFELIVTEASQDLRQRVEDAKLTGVHIGEKSVRNYLYEDFAAHILGFVNKDGLGQYGLEQYWNDILTGKEEYLKGEKGPLGFLFPYQNAADNKGADLILSVDYNIQYLAEKLLEKAKIQLNIEGGTIIVMNPGTGEILALANYPGFNPNNYSKENDLSVFQSNAVQKRFEPGSVFKAITMAAGLNEGVITPQTVYYDSGMVEVGGWPIYNYDKRVYPGKITMTEVLEKSINTGAIFAERQVGHQKFLEYIERFGIFAKTGIDLAGEAVSPNTEFKKGYEVGFTTASFGQGIEMTPIQLVGAFSAIANGGKLVKPYLVKEIRSNGQIIEIEPEIIKEDVISVNAASKLTAMLVSVVENGFGKTAKIPGYYVAGKTGTAQIPWSSLGINKTGYSDKTWQSFIGFAPAFDPRFLVLIKLDNPAARTAEYSAMPLFYELAKYIIDYYQIPPDHTQ